MERTDRPLRIFLEIIEEWGVIPLLHTLKDGKMQFKQFLDGIKDATDCGCFVAAGYLLHMPIG